MRWRFLPASITFVRAGNLRSKRWAKNVDLTSFTAGSGHAYYFQAEVNVESQDSVGFKLSPINDDKGQYLVGISGLSVSKPK